MRATNESQLVASRAAEGRIDRLDRGRAHHTNRHRARRVDHGSLERELRTKPPGPELEGLLRGTMTLLHEPEGTLRRPL